MLINPCTGARGATPHWTCIAANLPGHASPQVLAAQGAKGHSRQAGPSGQPNNQTGYGHLKGTGGRLSRRAGGMCGNISGSTFRGGGAEVLLFANAKQTGPYRGSWRRGADAGVLAGCGGI